MRDQIQTLKPVSVPSCKQSYLVNIIIDLLLPPFITDKT